MGTSTDILQAVDIIADSKIKGLKFDKTIIGNISKIEDIEEGRYRIEYETGNFVVYSEDPAITYNLGESVYVKIPEGDYSNKKFIEGKVINEEKAEVGLELKNTIIYADRSFVLEQSEGSWVVKDKNIFNKYLTAYQDKMIKVTGYFQGEATDQKNYGLKVYLYGGVKEIETQEDGSSKETVSPNAILDVMQMSGDPFNRPDAVPQSVYIKIDNPKEDSNTEEKFKIEFFNDNDNKSTENPMILTGVTVDFCEVVDFSLVEYYAQINAVDGLDVTDEITEIELIGKLYHLGMDITDVATGFQWYKETVYEPYEEEQQDKDDLNTLPRIDWVLVPEATTANLIITDKGQARYKLVAYYEERKSVEQIITINPIDMYSISVDWYKTTVSIDGLTQESSPTINWYIYNYNNDFVGTGSGLSYTWAGSYAYINIKCAITNSGVTDILNLITKRPAYSANIDFEGRDLFHYDATGNIDAEYYEQEHVLIPKILLDQQIESVKWELSDLNTTTNLYEFIEIQPGQLYNPASSMLSYIWVDGENKLHYKISPTYDLQDWNNTFKIQMHTIDLNGDQHIYHSQKEILFVKDGQQGTNGTGYCFVVRPCTADGVLLSDTEAFIVRNTKDSKYDQGLYLRPFVYYNNKLITDNINMKWSTPRETVNCLKLPASSQEKTYTINDYPLVELQGNNINNHYLYVTAKAQIELDVTESDGETPSIDKFYNLYYNYPIPILESNIDDPIDNPIAKVDTLIAPKYVEYVVNGANPEWLNKNIECNIANKSATIASIDETLLKVKVIEEKNKLYPASNFNFHNGIGCLKFSYSDSKTGSNITIYYPVMMYLNIFGNEAINEWDGTEIYINNKNGSILAPQVGAGVKDKSDNTFTGIVMGQDYGQEKKIGLYGYNKGQVTLGLDQLGNAFFGLNKEVHFDVVNNKYTIGGWVLNRNNLYSQRTKKDANNTDIVTHEVYLYSGAIEGVTTNRAHTTYKLIPREIGKDENNQPVYSDEKLIARNDPDSISSAIKCDLFYATKYGQIGGWIMNENELFSQQCQLIAGGSSPEDKVPGTYPNTVLDGKSGIITTKYFKVFETKERDKGGNVKGQMGYIGGNDGTGATATLGISSDLNSIVLQTTKNLRLSAGIDNESKASYGIYFSLNNINPMQINSIYSHSSQTLVYKNAYIDLWGWKIYQLSDKQLDSYYIGQDGHLFSKTLGIGQISNPPKNTDTACNTSISQGWLVDQNKMSHKINTKEWFEINSNSSVIDQNGYIKINPTQIEIYDFDEGSKKQDSWIKLYNNGGIYVSHRIRIGQSTDDQSSILLTNNAINLNNKIKIYSIKDNNNNTTTSISLIGNNNMEESYFRNQVFKLGGDIYFDYYNDSTVGQGRIGSWTINNNTGNCYLDASGNIKAQFGYFYGWVIGSDKALNSEQQASYYLNSDGSIKAKLVKTSSGFSVQQIGNNSQPFSVDQDGKLIAATGSSIAGWTFDTDSFTKGQIDIKNDGMINSKGLDTGQIKASEFCINESNFINNTGIQCGSISLNAGSGMLTANNVTINGTLSVKQIKMDDSSGGLTALADAVAKIVVTKIKQTEGQV